LGGTPNEASRERLERELQLASLEWPAIEGPRRVDAVVGRIERGTYDLVLVLGGYVAHKESDRFIEAVKGAGIPYALVEGGYGVASVKAAIERFLGGVGRASRSAASRG
jgi:hypothetical protein